MSARRSFLFVPADRPDRVAKATGLPADVVVLELEDGVAPERKEEARANAAHCLEALEFGARETALRVNRITTRHGLDDLRALPEWSCYPDLLLLPKVESGAEVEIYATYLADGGVSSLLVPLVESARGLMAAEEIARSNERVAAIAFGGGDLSVDLGCDFSWSALLPHRTTLIAAAAVAAIPVIDVPFTNVHDEVGLAEEARSAREIGMKGKVCIHPKQLDAVNEAFSPTPEEVARARRILEAAAGGTLPLVVDGQMVDGPFLRLSERVVAAVEANAQLANDATQARQ